MKAFFAFHLFLLGLSLFLLPPVVSASYGFDTPLEYRAAATGAAWAFTLFGVLLRPSACCLAAFLVLTARGAHTPDHESMAAAVWFIAGLLCLPAAWIARDVQDL